MVVQEKVIVCKCASVKHAKMKFGESFVSEKKTCDDRERGGMDSREVARRMQFEPAVELKSFLEELTFLCAAVVDVVSFFTLWGSSAVATSLRSSVRSGPGLSLRSS